MKTKYPSMFGVLAALLLVASFIIPTNLVSPSPVQAGICKWDKIDMPGSVAARADIVNGSEINKIAVGSDGATILAIGNQLSAAAAVAPNIPMLLTSNFMGLMWSPTAYANLISDAQATAFTAYIFDVVIAPDDPAFWAVVTGHGGARPEEVWVTENAGGKWERTNLVANLVGGTDFIGCIDISVDYGGQRDIAVGIRRGNGAGTLDIWSVQSAGFTGWLPYIQVAPVTGNGDVFALKFSPTYPSDAALAVVYADAAGTWYNVALRDIDTNAITGWALVASVEVGDPTGPDSPLATELISADLELPSDFSGQAASLRRAYIATNSGGAARAGGPYTRDDGIFRMDDAVVYWLMDTSAATDTREISTIAYFGTYASGKLLAGEYWGYACTATVPTWFTDSPTTCPVPCWYPCLKCPTGAACEDECELGTRGVGNAQVAWFMEGQLAIAATGSNVSTNGTGWYTGVLVAPVANDESALSISRNNGETWNQLALIDTTIDYFNDFASSADCNTLYLASASTCAETGLASADILAWCDNTTTPTTCGVADVATGITATCGDNVSITGLVTNCHYDEDLCLCVYEVSGTFNYRCDCLPGCSGSSSFDETFYLDCGVTDNLTVTATCDCSACCGTEAQGCCCFDSVWRSSLNPSVVAPLPPIPPIGLWYERVYTRVTALNCTEEQSDLPLLRLAGGCEEPTGQIVGWAAQGTQAEAWSPDYGDYWANISARANIQDLAFESSTILYNLYTTSVVQKLPYTGTAWSTTLPSVNPGFPAAHMIAAMPEGQILVGYNSAASPYPAVVSKDGGTTFTPLLQPLVAGNIHVAFDPDYANNSIVYLAGDSATGSVYRNDVSGAPLVTRWADVDMLATVNGAKGCAHYQLGYYGLALAYTGGALYAATDLIDSVGNSGVERTLERLKGMPKPGIVWDFLDTGITDGVTFIREPYSLKLCGCCTLDTDTTMYALDARDYGPSTGIGWLWAFTDCVAKKGPALITEDEMLINCDAVSGRASEVNLCWEQLCVANAYDIEVAKDDAFTIKVIDWVGTGACSGFFAPSSVTSPCAFIPAGGVADAYEGSAIAQLGNLECGHTYYWRVQVRQCATGQVIRSPWSEVRSFTVKAGLPVSTTYVGLQLLSPNNGCLGCPVAPVSFSWSPYVDTTSYKFVLAKDAAMTQVVKEAEVSTTAFEYDGTLDYSTNYFWRVEAIEPAPSDWSATFSFQTEAAPAAEETPTTPATPVWVWVVIAIGAILVIVTLVLIFKTRRV